MSENSPRSVGEVPLFFEIGGVMYRHHSEANFPTSPEDGWGNNELSFFQEASQRGIGLIPEMPVTQDGVAIPGRYAFYIPKDLVIPGNLNIVTKLHNRFRTFAAQQPYTNEGVKEAQTMLLNNDEIPVLNRAVVAEWFDEALEQQEFAPIVDVIASRSDEAA